MKKTLIFLTILMLTASIFAAPADLKFFRQNDVSGTSIVQPDNTRDILLDQPPNQLNGIFADASCDLSGGSQVIADDFILTEEVTIEQIVIWGGYYSTNTPIDPDVITVIFHDDAAGLPGATISTETNVPYVRVQTGLQLFGVDEWMHTLTLANPVTLGSGNYWVEIYNDTGFGTDDYFWETGDLDPVNGIVGSAWATTAPGSGWNFDAVTDLSIQLIGGGGGNIATYPLPDSPVQAPYPGNPNPYSNTLIDFGWTTVNVVESGPITDWNMILDWESLDYPTEGSFWIESPGGTETIVNIYNPVAVGLVPGLALNTSAFNGEDCNGTWNIWIEDSYGDGGHQVTNATMTINYDDPVLNTADFTIDLIDTYGDGWNGGMIDLLVNGTVVLDDITLASGAGPITFAFTVTDGDSVYVDYTAGSWAYENEYYVYDNAGGLVVSSGVGGVDPIDEWFIVAVIAVPPVAPTNPIPADLAVDVNEETNLYWDGVADDFYVYLWDDFGTYVVNGDVTTDNFFDVPIVLDYTTLYHWRIDAENAFGLTTGTEWTFTTRASPYVTLPYTQTFEDQLPVEFDYEYFSQSNVRWDSLANNATRVAGGMVMEGGGSSGWSTPNAGNVWTTNPEHWAFTTGYFIGTGGVYVMDFDYSMFYQYNDFYTNMRIDIDTGAGWEQVGENIYQPGGAHTGWLTEQIVFGAINGNFKVRFWTHCKYDLTIPVDYTTGVLIDNIDIYSVPSGDLNGFVYEFGTTNPIVNAEVTCAGETAITDATGYYEILGLLTGTYDATADHADYFPETISVDILDGIVTSQNFGLEWAEILVDPLLIDISILPEATDDEIITLTNNGPHELTYSVGLNFISDSNSQSRTKNNTIETSIYNGPTSVSMVADSNPLEQIQRKTETSSDAIWDLQFAYDVETPSGLTGIAGAETDGTYLYGTKWSGTGEIVKFDLAGNFIEIFFVPGAEDLRDLAYDGQYMYGSDASSYIWEMDFNTQTLISTIACPFGVRAIAYDSFYDAFWINNWSDDIHLIDRSGTSLMSFTGITSQYGMAYDDLTVDGPFLWCFTGTSTGGGCQVEQFDLNSASPTYGTYTGVMHSVSGDLGAVIAGGLFLQPDLISGTYTLGGLAQGSPSLLFGYELGVTETWLSVGDPGPGVVAGSGGTAQVTIHFDATGHVLGEVRTGEVIINHNAVTGGPEVIPVTMTVEEAFVPYPLPFAEDFSSGVFPPADWLIIGDGAANWSEYAGNYAGGVAPELRFSWSPSFVGASYFTTPELGTAGMSELDLEYKHYVNHYGVPYSVGVATTSDGGVTWNIVNEVFPTGDIGPETVSLSVATPDVGSDNFQLAFFFNGNSFNINYWYIDDISIIEAPSETPNVFFSEYIEGSSYNKALEIYNGTGATINLDDFQLWQISNGGTWFEYSIDFPVGATLADEDVWVVCHTDADPAMLAVADQILTLYHNGNDAQGLAWNDGTDVFVLIDAIGEEGTAPTNGWDVAGVFEGTQNHTLVRKEEVTTGNIDWAASAGTTPEDSEWIVYPEDTFLYLGEHPSVPVVFDPPQNLFVDDTGYATWDPPAVGGDVIAHHSGYDNNGIGTSGVASWICAARFDATYLTPYYGSSLTDVNVHIRSADFTYVEVQVYEGGSFGDPGTLVYSQDITASVLIEDWTNHVLATPVPLVAGTEYWIGYYIDATADHPSSVDAGPAVLGYGDWMYFSGIWQEISVAWALDYNWCIEGVVGADDNILTKNPMKYSLLEAQSTQRVLNTLSAGNMEAAFNRPVRKANTSITDNRVLTGYNVYLDGGTPVFTTDEFYQYTGLVNGQTYLAEVTAVYDDPGESDPIEYPFTYNVTLDPPQNLFVEETGYATWEAPAGGGGTLQVDPQGVPYWTGTTDGAALTDDSEVRGWNTEDGWMMFDVSSIPDGSTITNIEFNGYVNATSWPYWDLTGVDVDPLTATPADLYASIQTNIYNAYMEPSTFPIGWKVDVVGGTANADLAAALTNDWFCLGINSTDNSSSYYINFDGWNETNPPFLMVDYESDDGIITKTRVDMKSKASENRDLLGYNVYLDGGTPVFTTDLFYQYTGLTNGQTYLSEVTALYDEGESDPIEYPFTYIESLPAPTNVSVDPETWLCTWEAPAGAVVFEDNFDSYTAGDFLCTQTTDWIPWSNSPGSSDDCYVVDVQSNSPSNSIEITGASDIIHPFGDLTVGNWGVSFMMYIEPTYGGYFNLLHEFTEWRNVRTEWALESYFGSTGSGFLHAGGTNAATFTHPVGSWFEVETLIDLDGDSAEYYVDGVLVHAWQWSLTSQGNPGLCQLGAIDIFAAAPPGETPLFYIDDFAHTSISVPTREHIGYNVYLDTVLLTPTPLGTDVFEYQFEDLIIGDEYTAGVSAVYDEGESEIIEFPFIPVPPPVLPPENLTAEVITFNDVLLNWEAPGGATGGILAYHIGYDNNGIGTGAAADWMCAARFTADELVDYYGSDLTAVNVHIRTTDFSYVAVKVWEGGSFGDPGTEVYSADITASVLIEDWTAACSWQ
jgi:hypothetical protein